METQPKRFFTESTDFDESCTKLFKIIDFIRKILSPSRTDHGTGSNHGLQGYLAHLAQKILEIGWSMRSEKYFRRFRQEWYQIVQNCRFHRKNMSSFKRSTRNREIGLIWSRDVCRSAVGRRLRTISIVSRRCVPIFQRYIHFSDKIDNSAQFDTTLAKIGENIFRTSWTNRSPKFFEQGAQGCVAVDGSTVFRGPFSKVKVFL